MMHADTEWSCEGMLVVCLPSAHTTYYSTMPKRNATGTGVWRHFSDTTMPAYITISRLISQLRATAYSVELY